MNNTINETIAQHESAIGLGSAIGVDIYMPYELNHLSEDCRNCQKLLAAMVFSKHGIEDSVGYTQFQQLDCFQLEQI